MNQRTALLIAVALIAFLLVLAGGLASRLATTSSRAASAVGGLAPNAAATGGVTLDPTVQALIQEREAAYQQSLAEANSRLIEANTQIAQANIQISALEQRQQQLDQATSATTSVVSSNTAVTAVPASAATTYAVSSEQARDIALSAAAANAKLIKAPELVSYHDKPAYAVVLDTGTVYVDAQSGKILVDETTTATTQLISQDQAIQVAQAYLGGGTVKSVSLRDEKGAQTYQVQFSDDSKVYVNARSGKVVYAEIRNSDSQYGGYEEHEHEHEHGGRGEHEHGD
ncbi:MAG: peptidase [Oscillochloris sp.]|nr:peptidase [Oscillochloris sp.]